MKLTIMGSFLSTITPNNIIAMTLAPFGIYFRSEWYLNNQLIKTHEKIHWKQQIEMIILPFYLWYGIEWFIRFLIQKKQAYNNISFEREAHMFSHNIEYLNTRKFYAWIKCLRKKD